MDYTSFFKHILPQIEVVLLVILIDFIVGVAASVKNKEFDVKKLPDILENYALKIIGWLGLEMLAMIPNEYLALAGINTVIGDGAMGLIIISAIGSILKSSKDLKILPEKKDEAPVQ